MSNEMFWRLRSDNALTQMLVVVVGLQVAKPWPMRAGLVLTLVVAGVLERRFWALAQGASQWG